MKKLDHPNVCKLYNTFKEGDIIYIIIEYMDNGDLFTFIKANKKFGKRISEDKLWNIFQQCLNGLVYIHSLGIIHRDIKPANFLLNSEGQIKLSDFSVSTIENIEKVNNFTKDIKKKEELIN
jgi:non-specific serine/threonine protein kinase